MDSNTAVVILQRMERRLFGESGDNGLVGRLQEADDQNEARSRQRHEENKREIAKVKQEFDRAKWLVIGFVAAWGFLTGSGTVTLDSLLKVLKH